MLKLLRDSQCRSNIGLVADLMSKYIRNEKGRPYDRTGECEIEVPSLNQFCFDPKNDAFSQKNSKWVEVHWN